MDTAKIRDPLGKRDARHCSRQERERETKPCLVTPQTASGCCLAFAPEMLGDEFADAPTATATRAQIERERERVIPASACFCVHGNIRDFSIRWDSATRLIVAETPDQHGARVTFREQVQNNNPRVVKDVVAMREDIFGR